MKVKIYHLNSFYDQGRTVGFVDFDINDFDIVAPETALFKKSLALHPKISFIQKVEKILNMQWNPNTAWRVMTDDDIQIKLRALRKQILRDKKLLLQLSS